MQVSNNQLVSVKAELSIGVQKNAQETSVKLVNDLMTKSLEGSKVAADGARAGQGIGTNLNVVV